MTLDFTALRLSQRNQAVAPKLNDSMPYLEHLFTSQPQLVHHILSFKESGTLRIIPGLPGSMHETGNLE